MNQNIKHFSMKRIFISGEKLKGAFFGALLFCSVGANAQNVFDDIIAVSPVHTSLKAALEQEGLDEALRDPMATYTVFAPDNAAFDALAAELELDIAGLLALPNLSDILLYHVLGTTVPSGNVTNGGIVPPLSLSNTLKLTVDGTSVFVNQAQVTVPDLTAPNGVVHSIDAVLLPWTTVADIAIGSDDHTTLVAAVIEARLLPALTDPFAALTVFAPTDAAFADALDAMGISAGDLLASEDLTSILLYHVLGAEVASVDLENGMLAEPLNTSNTLKVTLDGDNVFINQAKVTAPNLSADNGLVHVLDAVVLPNTTVADIAIGSGAHDVLVAAVIEARLLPALTNPFAELTVFAPTDAAFADALTALNLTSAQLLASPDLSNILLYHVLGAEVLSGDLTNGMLAEPLNTSNTLKVTLDGSNVFINQAKVTTPNIAAFNGAVHVLDAVVLPNQTVADIALGSTDHTTLVAAVIEARLLPALTNPFADLTVFAPTNAAFEQILAELDLTAAELLASEDLSSILLYHVVGATVLSDDLVAGPVTTLNGATVTIGLDGGVTVNNANVTTPDIEAFNGVVHVIDAVLLPPSTASVAELTSTDAVIYPNPSAEIIKIRNVEEGSYRVINISGAQVKEGSYTTNGIAISDLENGTYVIQIYNEAGTYQGRFVKQ
jgi:uncharacterized surface protein with fasciclin (FAS1) repeats